VDQFIRKTHTDFTQVKLVSASRQVVAGMNYHYIYELNTTKGEKRVWDIVIYKDLQNNFNDRGYTYTVTLPDGTVQKTNADPASMFTSS